MSAPLPKPRHLVKCECGEILEIWDISDHLCVCGREYSATGDLILPRRYFGKEKRI